MSSLGHPRVHFRTTTSTNQRARALALRGVPHGTVVTAGEQTAGRGRQGRTWTAPADRSLLCSILIRDPPRLLPLAAGAAVADAVDAAIAERGGGGGPADDDHGDGPEPARADHGDGPEPARADRRSGPEPARIKWPNDVLLVARKVAGILVEGRPQERWAVVGVGLNVAVAPSDFPPELAGRAATLGLEPGRIEPTLQAILRRLEHWIGVEAEALLAEIRARDALLDQPVRWAGGEGRGAGIDGDGRLVVLTADGRRVTLDAGEVHLGS